VEIRTTTKKVQIKEMLASLLNSPDEGISQDPKTFGPANPNTWKLIKQVNGIQEPHPPLPDSIYTNTTRRLFALICFQAPVTRSQCLRTSSSADPRLIAFRTPLFHVDFQFSWLTVPPFRRGACHVKTARFVLSCHSVGTSLPEIALSA